MIVAGSVLALLLMGLAVDGFVNPADDEADDLLSDVEGEEALTDQSGVDSNALSDLLFPDDDEAADGDPSDTRAPQPVEFAPLEAPEASDDDAQEYGADTEWASAEESASDRDFVEIDIMTELTNGEEVSYVETFDPETDTLVLEFDGTAGESPAVEVDHDQVEDAVLVLANGVPVTLVEGAGDMSPENVRVVMSDGAGASDDPADQPGRDAGFEGPSTLPVAGDLVPDVTAETDGILPDIGETVLDVDETILGDVIDNVVDPVVDVVDTITDGLPGADVINNILDAVTDGLTDIGGTGEMLDARVEMDDAFGTGGDDAQTGTFNDDLVTGGSGQDALFGDEGDDTLQAGAGNDELYGDFGDDDLQGGAGVDFLSGGEGNDMLDGGADRDLLFGGDGDDLIYGGAADDFLQGGMGADTLNGGSGNDMLDGTFGRDHTDQDDADVLWGGDGDDTLIIGQGDAAHGGAGADTFVTGDFVENADIAGHVEDFDPGEDRIEVIFDPGLNPDPVVEVQDFADGSGADIILNGEVILSVSGAQGLDPNMIDLRTMA